DSPLPATIEPDPQATHGGEPAGADLPRSRRAIRPGCTPAGEQEIDRIEHILAGHRTHQADPQLGRAFQRHLGTGNLLGHPVRANVANRRRDHPRR
ncbi:MAG: hypothetical protein ABGX05_04045, partial [Pirellulaceae bacterium]